MFHIVDLQNVIPHQNDSKVVLVVIIRCSVHQVLVDQGNSIDILYGDAFVVLDISKII